MTGPNEQNNGEVLMKAHGQIAKPQRKGGTPLFASPWIALFLFLRREYRLARQSS